MQALASRSQQLTDLVAKTDTATGAIARQSQALEQALTLLPGTLNRSTGTFAGLTTTLDALDPLVAEVEDRRRGGSPPFAVEPAGASRRPRSRPSARSAT